MGGKRVRSGARDSLGEVRQSSGSNGGSLSAHGFSLGAKGSILLKPAGKREDYVGLSKGSSLTKATSHGTASGLASMKCSGANAALVAHE